MLGNLRRLHRKTPNLPVCQVSAAAAAAAAAAIQADATKLTSKGLAASITKLLTKPKFAAAAAAAGQQLRSRSGPQDTAELLLQFVAADAPQESVQLAAAAADVAEKSAGSAGPHSLHVVDSASEVVARAGDIAAVKDTAGAAAEAVAGKGANHQQIDINVHAMTAV
jgi:hypothetical protein